MSCLYMMMHQTACFHLFRSLDPPMRAELFSEHSLKMQCSWPASRFFHLCSIIIPFLLLFIVTSLHSTTPCQRDNCPKQWYCRRGEGLWKYLMTAVDTAVDPQDCKEHSQAVIYSDLYLQQELLASPVPDLSNLQLPTFS